MVSEQEQAILHAAKELSKTAREITHIRKLWEASGRISIEQETELHILFHHQRHLLLKVCREYEE